MTESTFLPEIEVDPKKLPSRGLAYPPSAKISYRTYSHGEIRVVSTSTVGIDNSLKNALSGITTSFGNDSLTLQDAVYISIMRKISTLNTMKFEVPFACSKCSEPDKKLFSEKDIEFEDISNEIESLPLEIEIQGKTLSISPMTVREFRDLKNGKYNAIIVGGEIDKVSAQAVMVKNLPFKESYELLYGVKDPEDMDLLDYLDKALYHDMKPLKATCRNEIKGVKCNTTNYIKLGGRDALISPFRESEGTPRARIRFKSASKPESSTD